MFMGTYEHSLDTKNRLIIPAKFRNQLGDKFVIVKWMEKSLHAFTIEGWEAYNEQLNQLPSTNKAARQFKRFIFSGAADVEFDRAGRISIPSDLKNYATLDKDVVIIGGGEASFEIWDAQTFKAYNDDTANNFDEIVDDFDFDI
ncbi:MAG: division/cell wall cluster transcriptional repressor MraZ [Lactobacillaceae bacterium]|jgi:MraZ protein|nr:division/cell wall cluster transcriptional repressor MraZ [Lactobacillaceae bacterium]